MIELLCAPENIPFSVALVMLIALALLEGIATVLGFGFSQLLDNLLPDIDMPEMDVDIDADVDVNIDIDADTEVDFHTPSLATRVFGWIKVAGVPMIVVLVVFLATFTLLGFTVQWISIAVTNHFLPAYIAAIPAFLGTVPLVRRVSLFLAKFVMKDETSAVSTNTFVGKIATITIGTARKGVPAQAKLTDKFGQVHYLMVEPDEESTTFTQSSEVLLVKKQGSLFKAIRNPNVKLTD